MQPGRHQLTRALTGVSLSSKRRAKRVPILLSRPKCDCSKLLISSNCVDNADNRKCSCPWCRSVTKEKNSGDLIWRGRLELSRHALAVAMIVMRSKAATPWGILTENADALEDLLLHGEPVSYSEATEIRSSQTRSPSPYLGPNCRLVGGPNWRVRLVGLFEFHSMPLCGRLYPLPRRPPFRFREALQLIEARDSVAHVRGIFQRLLALLGKSELGCGYSITS
jgi:hypothetical protein